MEPPDASRCACSSARRLATSPPCSCQPRVWIMSRIRTSSDSEAASCSAKRLSSSARRPLSPSHADGSAEKVATSSSPESDPEPSLSTTLKMAPDAGPKPNTVHASRNSSESSCPLVFQSCAAKAARSAPLPCWEVARHSESRKRSYTSSMPSPLASKARKHIERLAGVYLARMAVG